MKKWEGCGDCSLVQFTTSVFACRTEEGNHEKQSVDFRFSWR
jgi:hypothetical protein